MAVKKTGISRELVIHPGETIADILDERGITQTELASQTGVSPAYVSKVIAGKKDISAKFAFALEYALGVPKSFWLNLQANYQAELMELNESETITDEEREARKSLNDIVKYLRQRGKMPVRESIDESIISLRKALKFSNIANLKEVVPEGAFRMASNMTVNPYVLGAWIRMCQLAGNGNSIATVFDISQVDKLIDEIKKIMTDKKSDIQTDLRTVMARYGIDFSVVRNFRGAPVHGYLSLKSDGVYQMVVTIRGAFADIFWFSLFHEIGHIVNGDVGRNTRFLDDGTDEQKEKKADLFASNKLIDSKKYAEFVERNDYSIDAIITFAKTQEVMPYIVIGRLQKEKRLPYSRYSEYKLRYKWAE